MRHTRLIPRSLARPAYGHGYGGRVNLRRDRCGLGCHPAPTLIKKPDPLPEPTLQARNSSGIRVLGRRRPRAHAHAVLRRGTRPGPPRGRRPRDCHLAADAWPLRPRGARGPAIREMRARVDPPDRPRSGCSGRVDRFRGVRPGPARPRLAAPRQPASRPRRVVLRSPAVGLVGTLAVVIVGGVVGGQTSGLPAWAPAVPAVGIVVYVLYVRREARRLEARRRRQRAADMRQLAARLRAEAAVAAAVEQAARAEPQAVRPGTIHADGSWEPMRIPLPTFVTAPIRAPAACPRRVGGCGGCVDLRPAHRPDVGLPWPAWRQRHHCLQQPCTQAVAKPSGAVDRPCRDVGWPDRAVAWPGRGVAHPLSCRRYRR